MLERGRLKQALLKIGFPIEDLAGYTDGDELELGLREITREGFEYELTINLELDTKHNVSVSKDRTGLFMGKPSFVPSQKTGKLIADWCEQGDEVANTLQPGSDWYGKVDQCATQKELVELYNSSKAEVDTNPLLQQLISNRRAQINGKTLTAA
jgi:hypothetical protein